MGSAISSSDILPCGGQMRPLDPQSYRLLRLVIQTTPFTERLKERTDLISDVPKAKRKLLSKGLIQLTGEDGIWERMWPTQSGKLMFEWQAPHEAERIQKLKEEQNTNAK